jgi:hypothetical protein
MTSADQPLQQDLYDVAISFAERDEAAAKLAVELKTRLARRGLRVFYFRSVEDAAAALGERLHETLRSVYRDRSRIVVAIGSQHYAQTVYTLTEIRAALMRPRDEDGRARLIPLSADGNPVPGIPRDTAYVSLDAAPDLGNVVAQLCQRCGRPPEAVARRRRGGLFTASSMIFLFGIWMGDGEPSSVAAMALLVAAGVGGPAWVLAFLAVPSAWMAARRRAVRGALRVLTEGPRLLFYRRVGDLVAWVFVAVWWTSAAAVLVDRLLEKRILADLRAHRIEAAKDRWSRLNPSLLFHRARAQLAINEAIASTVRGSTTFEEGLGRLVQWGRDPVRLSPPFEAARQEFAGRNAAVLVNAAYAPPGRTAASWWDEAWEVGLWPPSAREWPFLVARLGARQLLTAFADEGSDPFTWPRGRLRDFEWAALQSYARELVARGGLERWGGPRHRLALIALTQDWSALQRVAKSDIRGDDPPRQSPEALAFVSEAPPEALRPWLAANLGPWTKGYVLNPIGKAVEARGDPESMFVLLDLADAGRLPYDPFSRISQPLALPDSPRTVALALDRLRSWLRTGSLPRTSVLRCLLRAVSGERCVDGLKVEEREALVGRLVALLDRAFATVEENDPNFPYREVAAPAYEVIARAGTPEGVAFLEQELDAWVARRHMGSEQRESLLRALRISPLGDSARPALKLASPQIPHLQAVPIVCDLGRRALMLARATRQDAERWKYDDSAVQAEYLLTLAARPVNLEDHVEYLSSLLDLFSSAATKPKFDRPISLAYSRRGFVELFRRLDEGQLVSVFGEIHPNGGDGARFSLRGAFFLSALHEAGRKVPGAIESGLLEQLEQQPAASRESERSPLVGEIMDSIGDPAPWDKMPRLLSDCGGPRSVAFFRRLHTAGRDDVLPMLGRLGDTETLRRAIAGIGDREAPRRLEFVMEAVRALPRSDLPGVLMLCLENRHVPALAILHVIDELPQATRPRPILKCLERGDAPTGSLLGHAARAGLRDERLVTLACGEFTRPGDIRGVASALSYLEVVAPGVYTELLQDRAASARVARALASAGDEEWYDFADRITLPDGVIIPQSVVEFAAAKAGLIALNKDQVPEREWAPQGYFPWGATVIRNPLLALLASDRSARSGRDAVRLTALTPERPVVVIGNLSAPPQPIYRAYGLWIAAGPFRKAPPSAAELLGEFRILNDLFSGNEAMARGAASLCLSVWAPWGARGEGGPSGNTRPIDPLTPHPPGRLTEPDHGKPTSLFHPDALRPEAGRDRSAHRFQRRLSRPDRPGGDRGGPGRPPRGRRDVRRDHPQADVRAAGPVRIRGRRPDHGQRQRVL